MKPVLDPASTKYPERTFFAGMWRTAEQVKQRRATIKKVDSRRIQMNVAGIQFGYPVDPERKEELQAKLAEFRKTQSRTREDN